MKRPRKPIERSKKDALSGRYLSRSSLFQAKLSRKSFGRKKSTLLRFSVMCAQKGMATHFVQREPSVQRGYYIRTIRCRRRSGIGRKRWIAKDQKGAELFPGMVVSKAMEANCGTVHQKSSCWKYEEKKQVIESAFSFPTNKPSSSVWLFKGIVASLLILEDAHFCLPSCYTESFISNTSGLKLRRFGWRKKNRLSAE